MIWKVKPLPEAATVRALQEWLGTSSGQFPHALAVVLAQRGIVDMGSARRFLSPTYDQFHDPFLMRGMETACERILKALERNENILIYGDYDVDGTTSVALLQLFLKDVGYEFETYIPNRFTEGYGISYEGIQHAIQSDCGLMIALDCGTKAVDKVRFANDKGLDVIIVDHHTPGEALPPAVAMLNPLQPECKYPDKSLSACALTMKLCQGLCKMLPSSSLSTALTADYNPFSRYADLVALSIACDIVPLEGENRAMLHFGLEKIRTHPLPGIQALKELHSDGREWSVSDLVFYMGPRINSAGRLKNATEAVVLLTGKASNLNTIAQSLDAFNEERKQLDKGITQQALEMIAAEETHGRRASTVLFHEDWSKGIIGIVASRLIERYYRPTILLTRSGDYLVGSGRSVAGFDLHLALEACAGLLVQFGGHKYAAGLTLREQDLPAFKSHFENWVAENIEPLSKEPELRIDAEMDFDQLDARFIRLLRRLSPFGPSNPEPNFLAKKVQVKDVTVLKQDHVRFLLEQGGVTLEGIGFFMASHWAAVNRLSLDVVYQPDVKRWNGKSYIQLKIKDFI